MQTFLGHGKRLFRAAIFLGIATMWSGGAFAAQGGGSKRVLLIKTQRFDEVGGIVASRVDKALGTALALESKIELVLPEGLEDSAPAAPVAAPVTDETLIKAGKIVDQAKEEFSKGKYMQAVKTFKRAMGYYEKKLALLENFDLYVDAQLGKALAYFAAGYDDNGEDELGKVLTMRPTLVLDKRRAPKGAIDALQRLQLLYARAQASPIIVETKDGVAASVYVDGVLAGPAPATLDKLLRGRHWVRVVADGYEPWSDDVVASAKQQTLTARLKAIRQSSKGPAPVAAATPEQLAEAARTGTFGPTFDKGAAGLCSKFGLTGIMLTYVTKASDGFRLAGFYFDARAGKTSEVEGVRLDPELFDLQVNALTLSEHLVGAATGFPTKVTITQTPEVYRLAEAEAAKAEAARVAAAQAEAERAAAAKAEAERLAVAKAEAARAEAARSEAARAEAARAEAARAEAARLEAARAEAARAEAARREAARIEAARLEAARAEAARKEAERTRAARLEAARREAEAAEARAKAAKAEADRAAAQALLEEAKAEEARREAERILAERASAADRAEAARLEAARAEAARAEAARAEAARAEAARAEAARIEAARLEAERRAAADKAAGGTPPDTVIARKPDGGSSGASGASGLAGSGGVHKKLPPIVDYDDDEFYETWWFWAAVIAVGAGATATYFALDGSGGDTPSGFRSTVTF